MNRLCQLLVSNRILSLLILWMGVLSLLILPEALGAPPATGSWNLVFSDEFDGTAVNASKWMTTYPWGSRTNAANAEGQYYMDDAFVFGNGLMRIKADKRSVAGFNYTSGILCSYGRFAQKYGYFEMGARLPKGKGYWPAFWLLPVSWAWPPELDVMEFLGHQPTTVYMTNHYGTSSSPLAKSSYYTGPDFTAGYHVFGLEWRPDVLIWYVDGVERFRSTTGVPQEPMYLIANLAVGGKWPGYPDSTTVFPGYMDIDYIRAYAPAATTVQVPATPSNLAGQPIITVRRRRSYRSVKLTWADNAGNEVGYEVYRSTSPTGSFQRIASIGANAQYYTDGLGYSTVPTLYYTVRAYNNAGFSGYSTIVKVNAF